MKSLNCRRILLCLVILISVCCVYKLIDISSKQNQFDIEEYFPLKEGYSFKPKYIPDYINYSEEVILRDKSRVMMLITYGTKPSDIVIYSLNNEEIAEIYKVTEKRDTEIYYEILSFIEQKEMNKLHDFIWSIALVQETKVILKLPLVPGQKLGARRVIDLEKENLLDTLPEYLKQESKLLGKDIVAIKEGEHYFIYKKNIGTVLYYNNKLDYLE